MIFREFKEKWEQLPVQGNGYIKLRLNHPLDLQIGYSVGNYRSLIVMDTGVVESIPSSFAVKVINPELKNHTRILEFQLIHPSFEEVFLRLCWDMIESTSKSFQPLKDLVNRYLSWQKFLQYANPQIMGYEKQKGLLGELLYLRELLSSLDAETAVTAWNGPDGSDQDFLFHNTWAEVKAVSLAAKTVKISSLEQMNQEQQGTLVVYFLEKAPAGENHICLPDIVTSIKSLIEISPRSLDRFEMKLFKYGYRDQHEETYRENYFRLTEQRKYLVDDKFPKLTKSNVASEIVGCEYELSLASIDGYRRDE